MRNYNLLRALAQRHSVTLLSFAEQDRPQELDPLLSIVRVLPPIPVPIRTGTTRLQQLLTSSKPDLTLRLHSEAFEAALIQAIQVNIYDVVQIEGIELAENIRIVRDTTPNTKIILDCHNAETELQRRSLQADVHQPARWPAAIYSAMQIGRLARYERWAVGASDAVIAVSEEDCERLEIMRDPADRPVSVIPNTIDISEYSDSTPVSDEFRFDLVFTGKMDYRPNIDGVLWFADEIWPLIKRARPETTWAIVGQRPHSRLDPLRKLDGITITGHVPAIQPYLKGCRVYIAPLRIGSGTRLKLIEAMATGKAIVATTIAAEGFPVTGGEEILLADDPASWVKAVLTVLEDEAKRSQLGAAAQRFATLYDWRGIVPQLDKLVTEVIGAV